MREDGLRGRVRRRFRKTTDSSHRLPVAPNLLNRCFSPQFPDQVWASDITYIETSSGWCYLAVVMDLHSRLIVGWALADHLRTSLIERALEAALGHRNPSPGMIHHSDRGSQYASQRYRAKLAGRGVRVSMSRAGECYDNAVVESFFGTLKQELVKHSRWASIQEARAEIHSYIEVFYNRTRLHSTLGHKTPIEVDRAAHRLEGGSTQQLMSLPPLDSPLPGALPPDRRAAPELRKAQLRAAPPKPELHQLS